MSSRPRLEWLCRRGTKELDLLLQTWLSQEYGRSSEAEQLAFQGLLDWPDDKLIHLLLGLGGADLPDVNTLAGKIRALSLYRA